MKFHHIGVIVGNLNDGKFLFDSLVKNIIWSETFEDEGIGVDVVFGTSEDKLCYELIVPRGHNSPVLNHLMMKENMMHHIAFVVDDFDAKCQELRTFKLMPLGKSMPAVAFHGKRVAFFLTPIRTIVEIIES